MTKIRHSSCCHLSVAVDWFLQTGEPQRAARAVLATSWLPYRKLMTWDGRYADVYHVDLESGREETLFTGALQEIDVAPDGGIWFSQLNEHRIGRIDPDTFEPGDDPNFFGTSASAPHGAGIAALFIDELEPCTQTVPTGGWSGA